MIAVQLCVVKLVCFRAHLRLNFDLKAPTEPTGLLQRRPCDPTHRLQDALSHLLREENVTIDQSSARHLTRTGSLSQIAAGTIQRASYLQVSSVLLIVQVRDPIDKVIEYSARQKPLMSVRFSKRKPANVHKHVRANTASGPIVAESQAAVRRVL